MEDVWKKSEAGLTVKLHHDDCAESPLSDDESVKVCILHNRRQNPNPECGADQDEIEAWREANAAEWTGFPLYGYEHGNILWKASAGANPFHCPWDSGRAGWIFLKTADFGPGASLLDTANAILDEYTEWCNGECFGYVLETAEGETLDSRWGFIGFDYARSEAEAALAANVPDARAAEAAEYEATRPDMYAH